MSCIILKTEIPGPKSLALLEERRRYVSSAVSIHTSQIFVERADGALITDVDGNVLIDLVGGIGSMNVGHTDHHIVEAVKRQAEKLQHTCFMTGMYEPYVALAKKLAELTPGRFEKKSALFNSGAEAVENAIKFARAYTKRPAIISLQNGFHGRTLLTMSLTSKYVPYKQGFGPFAPEIYNFASPYPYRRPGGMSEEASVDETIERWHTFFKATVAPNQVAAVIFEPLQGEGGFIVLPKRFVQAIVNFCRENGIVVIADEVQSGFGRTGTMFVSEQFGIEPDLITMAKSLSNGFPLGAVTGRKEIMDSPQTGGIGGTFGGNPVSCAAALAAIETIEKNGLCKKAQTLGERIWGRMKRLEKEIPTIGEIRGLGAMIAVELVKDRQTKKPNKEAVDHVISTAARRGVLLLAAGLWGNVLRFLPPLSITESQIDEALDVVHDCLKSGGIS
ncbi:MAG: 4-aminobutyrate--2-oxoglutarate transaminase [Deltaproteobacteria bacterium]|nr:4-aminobutyrate--2-oxoglutarate transaminase [Deltaproteobacteria bacterium]